MRTAIFAGAACALACLTPAFSVSKDLGPRAFDAGAIAVERLEGKGPALIFIPGLASGSWTWKADAGRLSADHAVYLLTLPGFDGRPPVAGTTLDSLSKDLQALIESKHIDKPVLVGHSMGGTLSMLFATEHSDLISGIVAVDGLPVFPGTENATGDRSAFAQRARDQIQNQTAEQWAAYQQTYMKQMGTVDEVQAKKVAELSSRSDPKAVGEFAAQLLMLDLRPRLAQIKVPVVEISPFNAPDFAAMGVDEAGKSNYYRMLLTGIERVEVLSVSPARHFVMFDQPEKFSAVLDQALAKVHEAPARAATK